MPSSIVLRFPVFVLLSVGEIKLFIIHRATLTYNFFIPSVFRHDMEQALRNVAIFVIVTSLS